MMSVRLKPATPRSRVKHSTTEPLRSQKANNKGADQPLQSVPLLFTCNKRTSDGGNGNHSVSLPIILIKIKVDQKLPPSYVSSLLVSIL